MRIAVLGSGAWGLALASVLKDNGNEVVVYARDLAECDVLNKTHTSRYLPNCKIDENIKGYSELAKTLVNVDSILIAVPSKAIKSVLNELNALITEPISIINVTKGLVLEEQCTIQELIRKTIPSKKIKSLVSLLGPSFAIEVIQKSLTCVCAVSESKEDAEMVQSLFSNQYFRVYTLLDVKGAEIYSSMKNVIALCSGIVGGLGYGENTKASLVTRSLKELAIFGKAMGAKEGTFMGLTGLGDLILTCNSSESRNYSAGYEIGKANSSAEFLKNNKVTVEGILTCKVIYDISIEKHLELPIIQSVYAVLYKNAIPSEVSISLMGRPLKQEN